MLRSKSPILLAALAAFFSISASHAEPVWRLGFYWSPSADPYPPDNVPWSMYTHVSQMAIQPTPECGIDEKSYKAAKVKADLVKNAHANDVKVTITLLQDEPIQAIVRCTSPDKIAGFVATLTTYVNANNYDGLDLDWEGEVIPRQYQDLIRRLRVAMPGKILTADIAMHQRGYLVDIQDILDRINVMNYDLWDTDYHGRILQETWHHAALLSAGDMKRHQTAEAGIAYVLGSKIRPEKVNLAVPFYGYVLQGCQKGFDTGPRCQKALSSPLQPIGRGGVLKTQIEYNKVIETFGISEARWDPVHKTPYITHKTALEPNCMSYLCVGDAFITYTDEQQMRETVDFLVSKKLGGIMTFALHQEFLATRRGDARYPLSSAIYNALKFKGKL
jgi:GH18 family chitinase